MQARFIRAENNLKSLNSSVDLMKKESMKLLQRATLAEKEMINGQTELMYMSLCTTSAAMQPMVACFSCFESFLQESE